MQQAAYQPGMCCACETGKLPPAQCSLHECCNDVAPALLGASFCTLPVTSLDYAALNSFAGGLPERPISDTLGLANFPYIPITNANYSPLLTQLMSQHATWQVLQLELQLQQLLSG